GETKILAKVNGRQRTVSESSIRRHLKLNDEEDETAFLTGDVRYGEAFPTATSLDAWQDRENIAKTSAIPHEASPKVTSLGGGKGNDMVNVLGTLGAKNILVSGGLRSIFTTASLSCCNTNYKSNKIFKRVVIESSSLISINIPSISKKDKGKGTMIDPEQPSKEKVLEQISVKLARYLEAKFAQEYQIIREQAEIDSKIAIIYDKRELEMMIAELDRSNEMVAKYLSKYEQAEAGLSHDEKVELIDELL
nr:hypothetical protein [Tanacetum cinerariifolium]